MKFTPHGLFAPHTHPLTHTARRCAAVVVLLWTAWLGAAPAVAGPLNVPGWDLVWQDEFDDPSPNTADWELLTRQNSFNNEKQYYVPEQITTHNGNLVITATDQPLANKAYRSGRMESWGEWSYGRFEARIKLPTTQGMWPAFWLLPRSVPWPSGGEIDIMENRGSQPNLVSSAYHWGPDFAGRQFVHQDYTATDNGVPVNFHNSFHDYALEWEPGILRFSVDGNTYHTVTSSQAEIFDTPKSIILNLAVGGDFGGDPDGSTVFPQQMLVDYVRVWQRPATNPGVNLLANAGFDDAGGSLAGWTVFGNAIPNVSASSALAHDGTHALKIFGQFNGSQNFSGASQGVAITEGVTLRADASTQTPAWDTLAGKTNEVAMKIEFYSTFGAAFGSAAFLGEVAQVITDGSTPEGVWLDHTLQAVAPTGAVEARLSFVFRQPGTDTGAIWIDAAALSIVQPPLPGDYNNNGLVEQGDLDLVLLNWGTDTSGGGAPAGWVNDPPVGLIDQAELDGVLLNWGNAAEPDSSNGGGTSEGTSGGTSGGAVPEPASLATLALAGGAMLNRRRPRHH